MEYIAGGLVRVSVTFVASGLPADPTTVVLKYKNPAGTVTTWTYGVDNQVVKDGVGNYRADINASAGGTWYFRWEGTGASQGAAQDSFVVTASNL